MVSRRKRTIICAVESCKKSSTEVHEKGIRLSFHRFPKDPGLQKMWIIQCVGNDKLNIHSSFICSDHFLLSDFKKNVKEGQGENIQPKRLKRSAVPTKNLIFEPQKSQGSVHLRTKKKKKKNIKRKIKPKHRLLSHLHEIESLKKEIEHLKNMVKIKDKEIEYLESLEADPSLWDEKRVGTHHWRKL